MKSVLGYKIGESLAAVERWRIGSEHGDTVGARQRQEIAQGVEHAHIAGDATHVDLLILVSGVGYHLGIERLFKKLASSAILHNRILLPVLQIALRQKQRGAVGSIEGFEQRRIGGGTFAILHAMHGPRTAIRGKRAVVVGVPIVGYHHQGIIPGMSLDIGSQFVHGLRCARHRKATANEIDLRVHHNQHFLFVHIAKKDLTTKLHKKYLPSKHNIKIQRI